MYQVSNRDMESIIRFIEAYRRSVDSRACDNRTYNQYRMAGNLVKRLRAKLTHTES